MSHYTKERNIITFTIDGTNGNYKFDLATCQFFGLKGTPIKTCQKKTEIRRMLHNSHNYHGGWSNLERVLYTMFDYAYTSFYPRYLESIKGAERLDAIDFTADIWSIDDFAYINANFNYLNRFIQNECEGEQSQFRMHNFTNYVEFEKAKKELGGLAEQITPEMYSSVKRCLPNITKEEWSVAIYYLVRGKYWEYHHQSLQTLCEYITTCRAMDKEPQKNNNFMREYVETMREYELRRKEFDDKKLRNNYELHKSAFEFEYGNFVIVLPKSAQDIVNEGANMHHCVGSYVNRVVSNTTYIVFVRHKDTPNECYLTCQVSTEGDIQQYYLAYDRTIHTTEDIEFKNAFQNHLKANWQN